MGDKVLLITPAIEKYREHHHLPFATLALGSALDRIGVEYDLFDERVDDVSFFEENIADYSIVGVSMFTGYQTSRGVHWLREVRRLNPRAITIAGGPHVSALPRETARSPLVDFAVAGYGENSFAQLVEHCLLDDPDEAHSAAISGVYSKTSKAVRGSPTPKKYSDLQFGPIPYRRLNNIDRYINPKRQMVMYVSQYGCPALCTFCATPETRKWVSKPLELVYEDFETLDELTGFKQLCFFDATLFTLRPRTMELVQHLGDRFRGRQWLADARALELIKYSDDDFKAIKDCGAELAILIVGLESGSDRIAEGVVRKGRGHLKTFAEVARRLHKAGISLTSGVVFGFPGETTEDLKATQQYIAEIRRIHPGFRISTTFFRPLPGTDLYNLVKESGFLKAESLEDWERVGDSNHFNYNTWMEIPWMEKVEQVKYKKAYSEFVDQHGSIMI